MRVLLIDWPDVFAKGLEIWLKICEWINRQHIMIQKLQNYSKWWDINTW